MSERTTSRVIPRLDPNDSIPLLTEVFELPDAGAAAPAAASQEGVIDTFGMADSGLVMHVGDTGDAVADEGAAPHRRCRQIPAPRARTTCAPCAPSC